MTNKRIKNITQFELIPWLLGSCATLAEARTLLEKANIVNIRLVRRSACPPCRNN